MNKRNFQNAFRTAKNSMKSVAAKVSTGATALVASGAAFAGGGGGSPGSAIAGELSGGKADVMLVIAAAAVIIGVLILWSYIKRAK